MDISRLHESREMSHEQAQAETIRNVELMASGSKNQDLAVREILSLLDGDDPRRNLAKGQWGARSDDEQEENVDDDDLLDDEEV